ncbi:GDP-mannose 4,6-dehydratase [Microbacterium sp. CH12i]|uniref:GDP-mannose 4,6-dehydratase n=1 Tax=Microbacterium sp. CH12i TaxID=1479651 RepID=UPI000ABCCEC4|nr:GDP-mannose 4,6-dehydratase [Microbacterium sp. CH12i]
MTAIEGSNILVTGGAGFIGSHLVDALLTGGAGDVFVLDNLVNGRRENLADALRDPRVNLIAADARDESTVNTILERGIDVVFHLACLGVRHSLHDPRENHAVNATMTLEMLESAMGAGVRRFIHVSSSEVYGTAQYAPMDELHPTFPEPCTAARSSPVRPMRGPRSERMASP